MNSASENVAAHVYLSFRFTLMLKSLKEIYRKEIESSIMKIKIKRKIRDESDFFLFSLFYSMRYVFSGEGMADDKKEKERSPRVSAGTPSIDSESLKV
ncbi:hypothetical protein [Kluyvera sp. CHPC 1.251]|uniref:hypothetical protein n=1 Tax=Kluyvera sp. CHPC 1.251 TaxID=2995175 RepID=UPI002FD804CF